MANITEQVRRFARRLQRSVRCGACHLPRDPDRRLIAGPGVYICESCIALLATRESAADTVGRCSFCGRRDGPIAGTWPSLVICAACAELARGILTEDDQRSRPAT